MATPFITGQRYDLTQKLREGKELHRPWLLLYNQQTTLMVSMPASYLKADTTYVACTHAAESARNMYEAVLLTPLNCFQTSS